MQWSADDGYEPLLVRDREVDSARRLLQEGHRQILILDDFLGAQFLEAERGLALEESLLGLIRRIQRGNGEHKLMMTTRDYILQQARQRLERFYRDTNRLDRVTLKVEELDEGERARILVAQLDRAEVSASHIQALVTSGTHRRLVRHRNFTPRLAADTADDAHHQSAAAYPDWLEAQFDDPAAYWETAFRHLSPPAQHWLYMLAIAGGEAAVDDLADGFHALHHDLCAGRVKPTPMEDALKETEPNFAHSEQIGGTVWLRYATPAIGDLLQRLIERNEYLKARLVDHIRCFQHGLHLFQLADGDPQPLRTDTALRERLFQQQRACFGRPARERKLMWGSQGSRHRIVIPDTTERLIRLWRAWDRHSAESQQPPHDTGQATERNKVLAALAHQYLPDGAAWRAALARHPYEPLLALASDLPSEARQYSAWETALETCTDTADARALAEAGQRYPELGEYLAREETRFLEAIDDAADNEADGVDDPDQVADAITNLEAIEAVAGLDLHEPRHALMHRLEELQEREPEDDYDVPFFDRGEGSGTRAARIDALFRQLIEVAR